MNLYSLSSKINSFSGDSEADGNHAAIEWITRESVLSLSLRTEKTIGQLFN